MIALFRRMPPNTFAIAFGLAGLACMWWAFDGLVGDVTLVVVVLTVVATLVELVLLVAYLVRISAAGMFQRDLRDRLMGPFVCLVFVAGMLDGMLWFYLGVSWARYVVLACAIAALVLGGWLTGDWIVQPLQAQTLTPSYYLPTVASGLIGATTLQAVGYPDFALIALGIGLICWVMVASIVQYRLWVGPPLAAPLVPLLAIELAPSAVAGNALLEIAPGMNPVQWALIGYTLLMLVVQIRLIPQYRRLNFMPSFWAFTFSYAATANYSMHWLAVDPFPGSLFVAWVLAIGITLYVAWVGLRTVQSMWEGTYFPMDVVEDAAATSG